MMTRKLIVILLVAAMVLPVAAIASAQNETGSISGRVVNDLNGDGNCATTGEAGAASIPVQLVNLTQNSTANVTSGNDGAFRLSPANAGNWQITVNPGQGWRVTSQQTVQVVVDDDEPDVTNVVFCITAVTPTSGSISGTVFRDLNSDGTCAGTGEPGEPNIPVEFINRDDEATVNATSDISGNFRLGSSRIGGWQVTVKPGPNWRVTSPQTVQVAISAEQPEVSGLSFCIVPVGTPPGGQPVLPESGAPLAPWLLASAGLGLLFLIAGAGLLLQGRRSRRA
jgi:hypothetical protein